MKNYILSAFIIDSLGTKISVTSAETLGDDHNAIFTDKAVAIAACESIKEDLVDLYPGKSIEVEPVEVFDAEYLIEGHKYNVESIIAAGYDTQDAGYSVHDYFDVAGIYLGPDEHGLELSLP